MRPRARFVVVLLALVVCLGGVGVAVGQSGSGHGQETIVSISNTTNQLSPASVATDGHSATGLDVGAAVTADATRLAGLHERLTLEAALAANDRSAERIAVRDAVSALEERTAALSREQQALLRAHAADDLSTQALVSELIRLNAAVDRSRAQFDQLNQLSEAQTVTGLSIEANISVLEATAQLFEQPVLDRIAAAAAGTAEPRTVYLQGGPGGDSLVIGTVGERYLRQALVSSERNDSGVNQFIDGDDPDEFGAVIDRGEQLYPWAEAFGNRLGIGRLNDGGDSYRYTREHDHGTLNAFFDSATANVFYEIQRLDPDRVPVTTTRSVTNEGVEVQVAFTHPTGPARVSVTDGTGAVAGATITIGDQRVGTTDSSGSAWIVQPSGTGGTDETFRVTVTAPDGRLVSVSGP